MGERARTLVLYEKEFVPIEIKQTCLYYKGILLQLLKKSRQYSMNRCIGTGTLIDPLKSNKQVL